MKHQFYMPRKENNMEDIVTNEDIENIIAKYDYFYTTEDEFVKQTKGKFRLSETELRIIFRIINRCFIKWT